MDTSMEDENFTGKKIYFSSKKSQWNKMAVNKKYVIANNNNVHVINHDVKIRIHFEKEWSLNVFGALNRIDTKLGCYCQNNNELVFKLIPRQEVVGHYAYRVDKIFRALEELFQSGRHVPRGSKREPISETNSKYTVLGAHPNRYLKGCGFREPKFEGDNAEKHKKTSPN